MTKTLKPGISVVIMAHERQEETIRAVNAVFKLDFGCNTQVIVSDNPSTPEKAIKDLPQNVIHKVRNPSGGSMWHANQILMEVDHEWTLLTHDDDELLPRLGKLFQSHSSNPEIMVITGKSRIIVNGVETEDEGYQNRLRSAGLLEENPSVRDDLFDSLFDIGSLFPASAIIVRTEHLLEHSAINPDYDLAGDLAHSMALALDSNVVFDGTNFVMNYHIHGGNSVFSVNAAGGLMSDFTVVRLNESVKNNINISPERLRMLCKGIFVSRILSKAFHLDSRYDSVKKYAMAFNNHYNDYKISRIWLIPIPLGPLKFIVRRLMWKRLGVSRWGF